MAVSNPNQWAPGLTMPSPIFHSGPAKFMPEGYNTTNPSLDAAALNSQLAAINAPIAQPQYIARHSVRAGRAQRSAVQ